MTMPTARNIRARSIVAVIERRRDGGHRWRGELFAQIGGGMSVLEGVQREVDALPAQLRELGVASLAVAMARNIDGGKGSPSEQGKVLMDALKELRALAPPKKEKDVVDHLAERRAQRRAAAGGAEAADLPGS